jgi:hypothetical protein
MVPRVNVMLYKSSARLQTISFGQEYLPELRQEPTELLPTGSIQLAALHQIL